MSLNVQMKWAQRRQLSLLNGVELSRTLHSLRQGTQRLLKLWSKRGPDSVSRSWQNLVVSSIWFYMSAKFKH